MAALSGRLGMQGHLAQSVRSDDPRQLPNCRRRRVTGGIQFSFKTPVEVDWPTGSMTLTGDGLTAQVFGTTDRVIDTTKYNYCSFALPATPGQLFACREQDWAGVFSAQDAVCIGYHTAHYDLRLPPRTPKTSVVWVVNQQVGTVISVFNLDGTPALIHLITLASDHAANSVTDPGMLTLADDVVWVGSERDPNNLASRRYFDGMSAGSDILFDSTDFMYSMLVVGTQVWASILAVGLQRFNFDGSSAGADLVPADTGIVGARIVGSEVWSYSHNVISRWTVDGNFAGADITGGISFNIASILVVGSEAWVTYYHTTTVERYAFDGSLLGTFTVNGFGNPFGAAIVGTQVWLSNWNFDLFNSHQQSTISRFNFDTSSAGPDLAGNGMNAPARLLVAGTQVWAANFGSSISRFHADGSSAGTPIGRGDRLSYGIAVVGSQVWVANQPNTHNSISRFNLDGSSAGAELTGNGLDLPFRIAVVGTEVWVLNIGFSAALSRFNFDGSVAGPPYAHHSGFGLAVVGSEVWVTSHHANAISRYAFDGSSADVDLTGNGLDVPRGIAVVGAEVWAANSGFSNSISRFFPDGSVAGPPITGNGLSTGFDIAVSGSVAYVVNVGDAANFSWSISRFAFDTTSAGAPITGNGLSDPLGLANVGGDIWVLNDGGNSISRFNFDGSMAGPPIMDNQLCSPLNMLVVPTTKRPPPAAPSFPSLGLIVNGGFEASPDFTGWTIGGVDSHATPVIVMSPVHGGSHAALLGDIAEPEPSGDSWIYQTVSIPGGLSVCRLRCFYNPSSTDSILFDWQEAQVQDTGGGFLAQVFKVCASTATWTAVEFDLLPYLGTSVRIYFNVHQDGAGDLTSMYLDDVDIVGM